MQVETYRTQDVKNLIDDAKHIAIIPSKISGADAFAASVGLYRMLEDAGKDVDLIYSGSLPNECKDLVEKDEVTTNLAERELLVSVDYTGTNAEKVHYKTDNEVLTFKLGPVPKDFDLNRISAQVTSLDFDLIFVLGTQNLPNLGQVYDQMKEDLKREKIINVDNTKRNSRFGVVNVIDSEADNLSLIIFQNAHAWNLVPKPKAAEALLRGMTYKENNNH